MLDLFAIFSKSGIVLFTAIQNTLTSNLQSYLNRLIRNVILEDRIDKLQIDTLLLQFYLDNEFEFVYVIGYQKMLTLSYLDKFLNDIQLKFRDKYLRNGRNVADIRNLQFIFNDIGQNELKNNPRIAQKNLGENFLDQNIEYLPTNLIDFVNEFRQIYFACYRYHQQHGSSSSSGDQPHEMRTFEQSQKSKKTVASMIIKSSKNPQQPAPPPVVKNDSKSMKNGPENADNGRNNDNTDGTLSKDEILKKLASKSAKLGSPKAKKPQAVKDGKAKKVKKPTVWDFNGGATTTGGNRIDSNLDFSKKLDDGEDGTSSSSSVLRNMVDMNDQDLNDMQPDLDFEVSDDDDDEVNEGYKQQPQQSSNPKKSGFFGSLMNQFSYNKTLSKADLDPILSTLRDHLIAKNVAAENAQKLCDSVATKLIGQNVNTWISLKQFVRNALEESILRILSPNRNLNILREIQMKNNSPMNESSTKQPYVIVFCGVNGVGKSTNLAKIANWLLLNDKNVLVIACDTFRAGAIEQLRTHIRALKNLHEKSASKIDLYEKGYGKDSTGIAMEGIRYASNNGYDVCLVDTAGRMQGNEPLMKQLAKLIKVNEPDLTLFVGEALVGNEAVDQLVNFNRSLLDNGCRSATNDSQSAINGIVLTKFDTIDDQVGAAISMTYITGQPIVFVGVGQTYRDLKQLNAKAVVRALMK